MEILHVMQERFSARTHGTNRKLCCHTCSNWRKAGNWDLVGARKAIGISSREQLLSEYADIARADPRALLQQMVPGGDDSLLIAACYLDRESNMVAGFNIQKLVQSPEGFGT